MLVNHTRVAYFIFKGITEAPELQVVIFLLVLLIYLITLGGNMTIFLLICLDHRLHTPMYFFLANLSIVDISCSTVTLQRILVNFVTKNNTVGFHACITQCYLFGSLSSHELYILTAMSCDRYIAICKPLNYYLIMNFKTCGVLALSCGLLGFLQIIPYCVLIVNISCYSSNEIDHFLCDLLPIMKIACSDISVLEALSFIQGLLMFFITPFCLTLISYFLIIITILKIPSNIGRRKAFYTCSSHLTVIILLYITLTIQYVVLNKSFGSTKLFSLFNSAIVPMLNPVLYSLKNKDVKSAFKQKLGSIKGTASLNL
ncbi:PREDICTED: olfactory receptor 6C3-like [Nanorana parkeri]|uniref:olfactory receptor 6C3-like n=1 Tax=Nanorana parkeri TaxID=125878 RepID=UPI000854FA37|nr:PREDICTED: olfactory receptor 6C3-like [Nanorana parkeri]